ncbi:hypothetical protein [Ornithinibacillus contaminans]|uniref:hypothetical protein n=1 Tax=Ornithinibacillus contaminans TaxID=694055 RepID=UPI00064DC58B|nr:hypothetical protein [Ornithinibacillus contaminans]
MGKKFFCQLEHQQNLGEYQQIWQDISRFSPSISRNTKTAAAYAKHQQIFLNISSTSTHNPKPNATPPTKKGLGHKC